MPDYFSHDYGARNDPKLIKLQMEMGLEGIGIFWCIIEMMYEQSGYLLLSHYDRIAFALRSQPEKIKAVVEGFDLFENDSVNFWNDSCKKRLKLREEKSTTARNSVNKRWLYERNTNVIRPEYDGNTIKESKVKERKGKKVKEIYTPEFLEFWSTYPKKESKPTAAMSFYKLPKETLSAIVAALSWQCKQEQWTKEGGKYIPMPATYLNQRRWEDQPINQQPIKIRESILSGVSR